MSPQPATETTKSPSRRRPPGLVLRGNLYSLRLKVPKALQAQVGRTHVCRALGTGRLNEAVRRARVVAGEIEGSWRTAEAPRQQPASQVSPVPPAMPVFTAAPAKPAAPAVTGPTLQLALEGYLNDPGRRRHAKATHLYRHILGVCGSLLTPDTPGATPLASLTRADGRRLIETLRALPANYQRRFPGLSQSAVLTLAATRPKLRRISDVTINGYLVRLTAVLSWAAREGWLARNPWEGLKIAMATAGARQREPFSIYQLNTVLAAPLYTGCVDDAYGFAKPGAAHPRRGRFWLALIGLYSGLRLNEIGQLDVADVAPVDGVECFHVRRRSSLGPDKRVKTAGSERLVPVHPELTRLGFDAYLAQRRQSGTDGKLFPELRPCSASGYFSDPLSRWFTRLLDTSGAGDGPARGFHSLRHNFRDALRAAGVDLPIALALGGWRVEARRLGGVVAEGYGSGFSVTALATAIGKVRYQGLIIAHLAPPAVERSTARA
jgi:integrase